MTEESVVTYTLQGIAGPDMKAQRDKLAAFAAAQGLEITAETVKTRNGTVLGNAEQARLNHEEAMLFAARVAPHLAQIAHLSANQAAKLLNQHQIETPTGRPWSAVTVIRVRSRLQT